MIGSKARFGLAAAIAAGAALLCGCQTNKSTAKSGGSSTAAMGAINDKCPESGKPVKADAGTATWRGKTIGFCCPMCIGPWDAKSAKEKDAFVARQ